MDAEPPSMPARTRTGQVLRMTTGSTPGFGVYDRTALSPEWDRWFDEAFTDLISGDEDLVRAEFDALIAASWQPPVPPPPPAPPAFDPSRGTCPVPPAASTATPHTADRKGGGPARHTSCQRAPPPAMNTH